VVPDVLIVDDLHAACATVHNAAYQQLVLRLLWQPPPA
jgi:hypothetical protein